MQRGPSKNVLAVLEKIKVICIAPAHPVPIFAYGVCVITLRVQISLYFSL